MAEPLYITKHHTAICTSDYNDEIILNIMPSVDGEKAYNEVDQLVLYIFNSNIKKS